MCVSAFFVFYAMFGYPLFLLLISKIKKPKPIEKDYSYEPTVSFMIVAHNEEKCIKRKLENILSFNYPLKKIQILVASDCCTDNTDSIVEEFIKSHSELNVVLNKTIEHKGKTNAQNETQKLASGEILIMTDANSIFDSDAVRELVACFTKPEIAYVCGRLCFSNNDNITASSESFYWDFDLKMRDIESRIQTITAGNGSIYAVKNSEYIDINPIQCHDSEFPLKYALIKKKSLSNPDAVSYEKAGEINSDEFKRKVRMNRTILSIFSLMWRPLNIFKYKWFSLFYFGHRTCRYLIWFNHLLFLVASIVFTIIGFYITGGIIIGLQFICLIIGIVSIKYEIHFKPIRLLGYYSMMVIAQLVAVFKQITGKSKPVWEKAETTR